MGLVLCSQSRYVYTQQCMAPSTGIFSPLRKIKNSLMFMSLCIKFLLVTYSLIVVN